MNEISKENALPYERANELLRYENGKLFWRIRIGRKIRAGSRAGCQQPSGYRRIIINGRNYFEHRLVYLLNHGRWPKDQIDHIDGDRSNNQIDNLRSVTQAENQRAFRKKAVGKSSKFRGVCWNKACRKWRSQINDDGKKIHVGYFESEEEAALARDEKAIDFGFSPEALNFPPATS